MSRITFYQDGRLTAVKGQDHMLGSFLQLFDKELEHETPEGEGLVLDWSQGFGMERNLTGEPSVLPPMLIITNYIKANTPMET
jgi:hypothetical protein